MAESQKKARLTGQEMADRYAAGDDFETIAADAGLTQARISQLIRAATGMTALEYRRAHGWGGRDMSPARVEEVAAFIAAHEGWSARAIASKLDLFDRQVVMVAQMRGLSISHVPAAPMVSGAAVVDEMAARYRAGESTVELAARYGVSEKTIRRRLTSVGVVRVRRVRGNRDDEAVARELAAEWNASERPNVAAVARTVGVDKRRAGRLLRAAGLGAELDAAKGLVHFSGEAMADLFAAGRTLRQVAARADCSVATVRRRIEEVTGMSPVEYRRTRMNARQAA